MGAKRVLFLDDRSKRLHAALKKYAPPEYDLTLVCTVKECIKMLSNEGPWDILSLDHDLNFEEFVNSDREDCGMEVVRWICDFNMPPGKSPLFIIHTSNRAAGIKMSEMLRTKAGEARYERFTYD